MNNWYQAILDVEAGPEEASFLALRVVTRLAAAGIVEPVGDAGGEESGSGFMRPGKNFAKACGIEPPAKAFGSVDFGGMDAEAGPWVNMLGLTTLEFSSCPICATDFGVGLVHDVGSLRDGFSEASRLFYDGKPDPKVRCPVCQGDVLASGWQTQPHLGFCYLAFTFWNWPPFNEWEIDIPLFVSQTLGHKTVVTYGNH